MSNIPVEFLVINYGLLDKEASLAKFSQTLADYISASEQDTILFLQMDAAINEIFDELNGTHITLPSLASLALGKLGVNITNWDKRSLQIKEYIRSNAGENGKFVIRHGRGGGVFRVSENIIL